MRNFVLYLSLLGSVTLIATPSKAFVPEPTYFQKNLIATYDPIEIVTPNGTQNSGPLTITLDSRYDSLITLDNSTGTTKYYNFYQLDAPILNGQSLYIESIETGSFVTTQNGFISNVSGPLTITDFSGTQQGSGNTVSNNWFCTFNSPGTCNFIDQGLQLSIGGQDYTTSGSGQFQVEVPEPLTVLGSATALSFGAFFKRKLKSSEKETTNVG